MTERHSSRYAEKKAGANNKFYEVKVEEHEDGRCYLTFTYGRIGTEGKTLDKGSFRSFNYAVQLADEQFDKKLSKGYVEVTAMQAIASAVESLEERKTNGLSAVEIDVPRFHAGKSEARCKQFCAKWLGKLNIVRASRWDLPSLDYEKQAVGVLRGYIKEWKRICRTKAHGALADNAAAQTAAQIFFNALKDDAGIAVYNFFPRLAAV
jgi:predicted DNA-binding WGR domain protein